MHVGRNVKCLILTMFGVPRQVFVKAPPSPNIAFGENPSSAGRANASGQTGGHGRHGRFFGINATEPKNGSAIPARCSYWLRRGRQVLHFVLCFSTVLNIGHFADRNRCVVTKQVGEQEIDKHFTPSSCFDLVRRSVRWRLISADDDVWNAPPLVPNFKELI